MKVNIQDAIHCVNVDLEGTTCENCRLFGLDYSICAEVDKIKLEALEKQIPKNWIEEDIGDCEYAWKCPSCNSVFVLMDGTPQDNEYNYCPNCGQSMAERKGDVV